MVVRSSQPAAGSYHPSAGNPPFEPPSGLSRQAPYPPSSAGSLRTDPVSRGDEPSGQRPRRHREGMSLRANVLAAIVTATAALVLALILLEGPLVEYRQITHARGALTQIAEHVARAVEGGSDADQIADLFGAHEAARVTVLDRESRFAVGDTAHDGPGIRRAVHGPEIDQAMTDGEGWAVRDDEAGEPTLYTAIRRGDLVVRAARPISTIEAARESIRELILAGGLIAILAASLLTYVITNTMVRPVESLTRTADALASGNLAARARVSPDRRDEIGRLGASLDGMAARLEGQLGAAKAREERVRTMLDSMVEAVFVTDVTGRISLANRALDEMGVGPALGRKVKDVLRNEKLRDAIRDARDGRGTTVEFSVTLRGEPRLLRAHIAPLLQETGVVGVLHDVTDLKRAEQIRQDFVANASHELRTPLTAIRGFAETLRDTPTRYEEIAPRFLDAILRHTQRLQRLVDDLLALSRAESGDQEFELGPVDVGPVIRDVTSGLEAKGDQRNVLVAVEGVDGLPLAQANAWALDHVMINLIDNAVKYTSDGGQVTVHGSREKHRVILAVTDTGPGIAQDQQARIFERFYRVDAGRARSEGGTGLGLSIVKHLVQRMGGDITVHSVVGEGTTVSVQLNVARARSRTEERRESPRGVERSVGSLRATTTPPCDRAERLARSDSDGSSANSGGERVGCAEPHTAFAR